LVKLRSKTCKTQKLVSWKIWIFWDRTFVHGTLDMSYDYVCSKCYQLPASTRTWLFQLCDYWLELKTEFSFHSELCLHMIHAPLWSHQKNRCPLDGLFFRTTWVSWLQKGQTSLDFNEARDNGVALASAGLYADHLHPTADR